MFASLHTAAHAVEGHNTRPGLAGLLQRLRLALSIRAQRRQLAALDHRALRDIGLTPEQALSEASRPLWDVPAHWLR